MNNNTIQIHDCCMRQTIRKKVYLTLNAELTCKDCKALCAYYYLNIFGFGFVILNTNMNQMLLIWLMPSVLFYDELIIILACILNAMLIMGLFEELKVCINTLFCKCETRK